MDYESSISYSSVSFVAFTCGSNGTSVGGITGRLWNNSTIDSSSSNININCGYILGGLVGDMQSGCIITNSYTFGSIISTIVPSFGGGLVGAVQTNCAIYTSYSTSLVSSGVSGGLIGYVSNGVNIINCYATGQVQANTSSAFAGGLIGRLLSGNSSSIVRNCYSIGLVIVGGGLIADNYGVVTSSYWDIETSNQSSSSGGIGKTTKEMYLQETYTDWDFIFVWGIKEGQGYPVLL